MLRWPGRKRNLTQPLGSPDNGISPGDAPAAARAAFIRDRERTALTAQQQQQAAGSNIHRANDSTGLGGPRSVAVRPVAKNVPAKPTRTPEAQNGRGTPTTRPNSNSAGTRNRGRAGDLKAVSWDMPPPTQGARQPSASRAPNANTSTVGIPKKTTDNETRVQGGQQRSSGSGSSQVSGPVGARPSRKSSKVSAQLLSDPGPLSFLAQV